MRDGDRRGGIMPGVEGLALLRSGATARNGLERWVEQRRERRVAKWSSLAPNGAGRDSRTPVSGKATKTTGLYYCNCPSKSGRVKWEEGWEVRAL